MINIEIFKEQKDIVLDTGIYISYFEPKENELKKILREQLFSKKSDITLHGHYLLKSEIYYIMCRKIGKDKAEKTLDEIKEFINFINGEFLYQVAAQIKCKFPIALSDCFSISLSHFQNCPVIFLKEKELNEEIVKKINEEFNTQIYIVN
jgi:hypothetical protein